MSDAKPRTSLRSYWHTLPKKKEQTPLKTRVRYNKAISVHRHLMEPYVDVTAHTAPSQQAVSLPLQGMEVWDENESGNYALLWGVFIERGKSRVASRLTDFSESEEDLSFDHPEHEGAALDVRSAAKERRKGP
ncbi:hypothetical protein L1987_38438 [Smallanthus sonchifolius]|uniref:Uncharacterized protein n=1 Tax=Smallanthus sonchifolius TaxID=185202 RepID=A0ACB9HIZ5_9ASTR|nr:hypothetical protein L1987_38438 [Smallanthus sonchifolius]